MSTWRKLLIEQFPEFGHAPEAWDLIDAVANLAALFERSARARDDVAFRRVLAYLLWAESQSGADERFTYFCQDLLRTVVTLPSLRPVLTSMLNGRTFSQLVGYIEYVSSKEVVAEMAKEMRLARRAV
jgi:hypothetical protein